MVANFQAGGAAINALARACGAALSVVALDLDRPTGDIAGAAAMSEAECLAALNAGAQSVAADTDLLFVGEMGSPTPRRRRAVRAGFRWRCGGLVWARQWHRRRRHRAQGRGVESALALHGAQCVTPFEALRRLGGREIAAMAGAILAARRLRVPVLLDGFICCAAIAPLVAARPALPIIALPRIARPNRRTGGCSGTSGWSRCCGSTCGWARDRARRSRCRWCAPPLPPTTAWRPLPKRRWRRPYESRDASPAAARSATAARPVTGRTDVAARDPGCARLLAPARTLDVAGIVSSDLRRARASAEALAQARALPLAVDPRWRELDFGDWDGRAPDAVPQADLARFWDDPDASPRREALVGAVPPGRAGDPRARSRDAGRYPRRRDARGGLGPVRAGPSRRLGAGPALWRLALVPGLAGEKPAGQITGLHAGNAP
jgi:hypothetical protein